MVLPHLHNLGFIQTGISENIGYFILGLFRGREQLQSISFPGLHTVTFSVPSNSQRAVSSNANVVCGFVRGRSVIAENAVTDWLPGPDTSEIKFEWKPIHGSLKKNDLIISFFSAISSGLTTRMNYVDSAPKTKLGGPRRMDGTSLDSFESGCSSNPSMSQVKSSLQSSHPIES